MTRGISSFAALAALAIGAEAGAQNIDSIGSQVDSIRFTASDRLDQPPEEEEAGDAAEEFTADGKPKKPTVREFTFSIGGPFAYNTNAFLADTGKVDDVHVTPGVSLGWQRIRPNEKKPSRTLVMAASLSLNFDEYVDLAANDKALILGNISVQRGDPNKVYAPYAGYAPSIVYLDFYDDHVVTFHDFTVGVRRIFALGKDVTPGALAAPTLLVDVSYARREASLVDLERHQPTIMLKFSGPLSTDLDWVIKPQLQGRLYTGGLNDGREDYNIKVNGGLEWKLKLPKRKDLSKEFFKLALNVTLERNESDVAGKDYTVWDIGPSFSYIRRF